MVELSDEPQQVVFTLKGVGVRTNSQYLIKDINLKVQKHRVLTLMGASGAGKSTILKCLNRFHELAENLTVDGEILFHDRSIFDPKLDVDEHRRRVGMLFQQPVVFPKDIFQNVIFGAKRLRNLSKLDQQSCVERCLREVHLWNEVKDRLHQAAFTLSVGQQQRLCLARTLAVEPEVILMDEPTSALDEKTTHAIHDLILELKAQRTIVLVSHDRQQALRVSDDLAWVESKDGCGRLGFSGRREDFAAYEASVEASQVEH